MAMIGPFARVLAAAVLVVGCSSSTASSKPEPFCVEITLDLGSSSFGNRTDWSVTACAGQQCKAFSPLTCNNYKNCENIDAMRMYFDFPSSTEIPGHYSVHVVSDSGQVLYDDQKNYFKDSSGHCAYEVLFIAP